MQEGFSTNRPPFFDGVNFQYWKSRMEYYLMTEIDLWFSVTEGYTTPLDDEGKVLVSAQWTTEQKRKAQANAKATVTLQCGVSREQLNKVGPFKSAQDLWSKLLELHEGTRDSRIAKRDLLLNQLQNFSMKDTESVSELHGRFKEVLNGLHSIGETVENRDLVRYVLKSFPRNALWSSMVDAYKVSRDLSTVKIDELFCEMELHEQSNKRQKEKGVALIAGEQGKKKERRKEPKPSSSSESESEEEAELSSSEVANLVRKIMRKSRRYGKRKGKTVNKNSDSTDVVCYECRKQGHYRSECPRLKKKEEKKKKKKALKATWDDSSSESSEGEKEVEVVRHTALMALGDLEEESGFESDTPASSSDDEQVSSELAECFKTINYLSDMLDKAKSKIKMLKIENLDLKNTREHAVDNTDNVPLIEELRTENESLKLKVNELKSAFEKFTNSSQTLNLMLGSQRAVYNKAGIGYRPNQKQSNYLSLFSRNIVRKHKTVRAWIPKCYIMNAKGPKIWVPKNCIFYV